MKRLPTNTCFKLTPLALAIAAIASTPTYADEKKSEVQAAKTIDVIEVTGNRVSSNPSSVKFTRSLLDTAQTVNVVTSDIIEGRGATTLRDVLRNVSGISMQAGEGGTPAGDQLSIRGYSARTDIFVDNVRDFGGYTRDPFNLEQVEVVKGPSSDYSGRGSTGGSINLVSKAPRLEDSTGFSSTVGSADFSRVTVDVNRALENSHTAVRLNVMYHDQDVAGRDEVNNQRWGIAPSIAFGLETDTQVTVGLFYLKQNNLPDYGIPWVPGDNIPLAKFANKAAPVDFDNFYGLKERDFEDTETTLFTVQADHSLTDSLSLNNVTRFGVTDRNSLITAPRFLNRNDTLIRRSDEKERDQRDDIFSNSTNLRWDINTAGNIEHKVLVGMELAQEGETRFTQVVTGEDSPATDLFNPNPNDTYLENYQRTGAKSTADSKTVAAYLSDSMQVGDHWQFNASLRWDRFDLDFEPDDGGSEGRVDKTISYRAGLVYKPVPEGSIYLGYGTSFNPSTETLSFSDRNLDRGITDIDPEQNRSLELGTKWELFNRQLFLSAAIFRTEKTNARVLDQIENQFELEGEQRVQGIELGIAGNISEHLNVSAGYTYLDTEVIETDDETEVGNELGNSPKNSFNLWANYQAQDNFQIGFGVQYVDDRFNNQSNLRTAPAYTVYEMAASYVVNKNIDLRLNLQNLGDKEYIDYVGGGHFIPGLGRTVLLTTNFNF